MLYTDCCFYMGFSTAVRSLQPYHCGWVSFFHTRRISMCAFCTITTGKYTSQLFCRKDGRLQSLESREGKCVLSPMYRKSKHGSKSSEHVDLEIKISTLTKKQAPIELLLENLLGSFAVVWSFVLPGFEV